MSKKFHFTTNRISIAEYSLTSDIVVDLPINSVFFTHCGISDMTYGAINSKDVYKKIINQSSVNIEIRECFTIITGRHYDIYGIETSERLYAYKSFLIDYITYINENDGRLITLFNRNRDMEI